MPVRPVLRCVGIVIWAQNRPQGFWRSIMKILGLLADSILAVVRQPTFYTPLARPLITCIQVKLVSSVCTKLGGSSDRHRRGGRRRAQGSQCERHVRLVMVRVHGHTASKVSSLASKASPPRLLPPWSQRILGVILFLDLAVRADLLFYGALSHLVVVVFEGGVVVVVLMLILRHGI